MAIGVANEEKGETWFLVPRVVKPKDTCCIFFSSCHCKVCLLLLLVYVVLLAVVCPTTYFLLHGRPHDTSKVKPLPKVVTGDSTLEVDLGDHVDEISSISMHVKCSGEVYVTKSSSCSNLNRTETPLNSFNEPVELMQYLQAGSLIQVENLPTYGYVPTFMVVKSLNTFQAICQCSENSLDDSCFPHHNVTSPPNNGGEECPRACTLNPCSTSNLEADVICINSSHNTANYSVETDGYYFLEFGDTCPFLRYILVIDYNNTQLESSDFLKYTLQPGHDNQYSVTFPVPKLDFHEDLCVLFSTRCPSNRAVYTVDYRITAETSTDSRVFKVWGAMAVLGVVLGLANVIIFCWTWRRRTRANIRRIN